MPFGGGGYSVGDSVTWTGTNPDSMGGTGFGPSYYIENPGTVLSVTGTVIVQWTNEAISSFEPSDPHISGLEPTPP